MNIQSQPTATALDGGGWVVAWASYLQDGSNWGVYQQVYDADGLAKGSETQVNTYTTSAQNSPHITALDGGGWVVIWESNGQDGSITGIYQQVYGANGMPLGGETHVSTYTVGQQYRQQITALDGGGWVVTWTSGDQDGFLSGVYQQAYAADGTPEGGEIQVNTYTTGDQSTAKTTALDGGGWVVTWASALQDGSSTGVYQKVFHVNDAPLLADAIANQTASDDQAFSFTIPDNAFTDSDGDALTYTATLAGGGQLPDWLDFDPSTRTFSGTPGDADIGAIDIEVTVSDGINPDVSDTFTLTVGDTNDSPQGADNTITVAEDSSHNFAAIDFGFTDVEGDTFSAVIITTLPAQGKLRLDGVAITAGQEIAVGDLGDLVWKPARNANGDALASFTFQVIDDGGTDDDGVDTDPSANIITFDVTEVIDRFIGDARGGRMNGTSGDDILRGRRGDDILFGKGGDDSLRSVGGNDRLVGGSGADIFVFSTGSDRDTIADFETGIDHINVAKWKAIDDFADVKSHARNHGDDVWITAGHDVLIIKDMHKGDLDAGDFVF